LGQLLELALGPLLYLHCLLEPEHSNLGDMLKLISGYTHLVEEEDNLELYHGISLDELHVVIGYFNRDKIHGLDKWNVEFYKDLFELFGDDLLKVME
jgi:hypothetical protein